MSPKASSPSRSRREQRYAVTAIRRRMNTILAVARAAHNAGAVLVFGELVFLSMVWPAGRESVEAAGYGNGRAACSRRINVIWVGLAIAVAADCIWLGAEAAVMSGLAWEQAIRWDTLSVVLGK